MREEWIVYSYSDLFGNRQFWNDFRLKIKF